MEGEGGGGEEERDLTKKRRADTGIVYTAEQNRGRREVRKEEETWMIK